MARAPQWAPVSTVVHTYTRRQWTNAAKIGARVGAPGAKSARLTHTGGRQHNAQPHPAQHEGPVQALQQKSSRGSGAHQIDRDREVGVAHQHVELAYPEPVLAADAVRDLMSELIAVHKDLKPGRIKGCAPGAGRSTLESRECSNQGP